MIRIATVSYLNALPLHQRLDPLKYKVITDIPARIAEMLHEGEVDVALAPVAAALTDGDYRIVPGVAIGSDGPVESVLLVSECPVAEWTHVVLDGESRTSAVLAQVLLQRYWKRPEITVTRAEPGDAVRQATGTTAALVIGDRARKLPDRLVTRVDLGRIWQEWTSLPFVFAVWAGRPELPHHVIGDLRAAAKAGQEAVLRQRTGADLVYLTERIRYGLADRELMGLRRFAAFGRDLGLLGSKDVVLYGPSPSVKPRLDVDSLLSRGAEGERLSREQALLLATDAKVADLGAAANLRRRGVHRNNLVRFDIARELEASVAAGEADATLHWAERIQEAAVLGATEVWIKEAHALSNPDVLEVLTGFVSARFKLAPRAFTAIELALASQKWGIPIRSLSQRLHAEAVTLLPATLPNDETAVAWLDTLSLAHTAGLESVVTLRIGEGESWEDRVDRLLQVRDLGRAVCGVGIELADGARADGATATDLAAMTALARLVLNEVRDVFASAHQLGTAQTLLHMGANRVSTLVLDAQRTRVRDRPFHDLLEEVERNVQAAGFHPVGGQR